MNREEYEERNNPPIKLIMEPKLKDNEPTTIAKSFNDDANKDFRANNHDAYPETNHSVLRLRGGNDQQGDYDIESTEQEVLRLRGGSERFGENEMENITYRKRKRAELVRNVKKGKYARKLTEGTKHQVLANLNLHRSNIPSYQLQSIMKRRKIPFACIQEPPEKQGRENYNLARNIAQPQ